LKSVCCHLAASRGATRHRGASRRVLPEHLRGVQTGRGAARRDARLAAPGSAAQCPSAQHCPACLTACRNRPVLSAARRRAKNGKKCDFARGAARRRAASRRAARRRAAPRRAASCLNAPLRQRSVGPEDTTANRQTNERHCITCHFHAIGKYNTPVSLVRREQ